MSYLSKFVFNPIKAAIARAESSSNPVSRATGTAAAVAVGKIAQDVSHDALSHNTVIGLGNSLVGDLETGLRDILDAFVDSAVRSSIPVVGGMIAPEAVKLANCTLDFAEQHAMTYVAALFAHHKAAVATAGTATITGVQPNLNLVVGPDGKKQG
jgi:hypothetical protein